MARFNSFGDIVVVLDFLLVVSVDNISFESVTNCDGCGSVNKCGRDSVTAAGCASVASLLTTTGVCGSLTNLLTNGGGDSVTSAGCRSVTNGKSVTADDDGRVTTGVFDSVCSADLSTAAGAAVITAGSQQMPLLVVNGSNRHEAPAEQSLTGSVSFIASLCLESSAFVISHRFTVFPLDSVDSFK